MKAPREGFASPDLTKVLDGVDAPIEREVYAPEVAPDRLTTMTASRPSDGAGITVDVGTWQANYGWDAAGVIQRREWAHAQGLALPLLVAGDDVRLLVP